ncbi:hypothetical protein BZL30_1208 [Mycobacterium kansasii]|uniref:Uncharacterized protein n=1 Tax=Mycobacterium kansasii TaxID=1768 RepID=A0A1V3XTJ9_MYCKA|nr:hypothetical protein BZL30_1208 [Mycobacterium kansasii]
MRLTRSDFDCAQCQPKFSKTATAGDKSGYGTPQLSTRVDVLRGRWGVMEFLTLPPEVNSARILRGPGPAPLRPRRRRGRR